MKGRKERYEGGDGKGRRGRRREEGGEEGGGRKEEGGRGEGGRREGGREEGERGGREEGEDVVRISGSFISGTYWIDQEWGQDRDVLKEGLPIKQLLCTECCHGINSLADHHLLTVTQTLDKRGPYESVMVVQSTRPGEII